MATVSRAYAQMSGKEIFAKKVSILNNKERRGGGVWRETIVLKSQGKDWKFNEFLSGNIVL